jgi:hypothetical protein
MLTPVSHVTQVFRALLSREALPGSVGVPWTIALDVIPTGSVGGLLQLGPISLRRAADEVVLSRQNDSKVSRHAAPWGSGAVRVAVSRDSNGIYQLCINSQNVPVPPDFWIGMSLDAVLIGDRNAENSLAG